MTPTLPEMVIFVTGASRGIGYECAKGFLNEGASVVTFSRGRTPLEQRPEYTDQLLSLTGDIAARNDVDSAVRTTIERFGRIDVLVNNAGVLSRGPFLEVPFEQWTETVMVNLVGLAYITRLALPGMLQRGFGRIINIVSRSAENPHPDLTAYAASKSGVVTFTRALATEISPAKYPNVQVNGLIPGLTRTAMFDEMGWGDPNGIPGPESIYPHIRRLSLTPPDGPHGGTFWGETEYIMYKEFGQPRVFNDISDIPTRPDE